MGFGMDRFVGDVDPNLVCGVCRGVLQDAVLTSCGHTFCRTCLHTWLSRPPASPPTPPAASLTCPECRAPVVPGTVSPVLALRNLVGGLHVRCDLADRGCPIVVRLDSLAAHLRTCPFAPVLCAGCGQAVSKLQLAGHQMECPGIAASVRDDKYEDVAAIYHHPYDDHDDEEEEEEEEEEGGKGEEMLGVGGGGGGSDSLRWKFQTRPPPTTKSAGRSTADVGPLMGRIRALEVRVDRLLHELRAARTRNLALEREYETISAQLREKRREVNDLRHLQPFLDRECVRTPEAVAKLSLFIARHLLQKPRYVEADTVFEAVQQSYNAHHALRPGSAHDVHMLLATAYASNWFSPRQRLSINLWLHNVSRTGTRAGCVLLSR